jgi:hypothetical protein
MDQMQMQVQEKLDNLEQENKGLKTLITKLIAFTGAPFCEHEITDTINNIEYRTCNQCNEYVCTKCHPCVDVHNFGSSKCFKYHRKCYDACKNVKKLK